MNPKGADRMPSFQRRLAPLFGGLLMIVPAVAAHADEPVVDALKGLVAGIDASPSWKASYSGLTYDATTMTATLTGLVITPETGAGAKLDVNTITVSGYQAADDGGFAASAITAAGMTVDLGIVKVAIDDLGLNGLSLPAMAPITYDAQHPFTSLIHAYAGILKAKLAGGHIGSLAVLEIIGGITSRISYEHFTIGSFADGKLASVTAGPLKLETPSPEGLVTMTVGSVESHDVDLGQFIRVYDPSAYEGGVGDLVWHNVIGLAAYHDVEMDLPGAKVMMHQMAAENFKMRQPKQSFGDFLDAVMVHAGAGDTSPPDAAFQEMALNSLSSLVDAFGIGRFAIDGFKVEATGIDVFALDHFQISDFSSDGLGEFALDGFVAAVEGQGSVKVGHFAFGGMTFPALADVIAAAKGGASGAAVTNLIPHLGFVEAAGLEITAPEVSQARLGKLRIDLSNYIGALPTSGSAEVSGAEVPIGLMKADAQATLKRLGYDKSIVVSYGGKYAWDESQQILAVDNLHFGVADMGSVAASGRIAGVTRAMFEHPQDQTGVADLALIDGKVAFTDESIVTKSLGLLAEKMHMPSDKFRQQFADALPFLLSMSALNNPTMMAILKQSGLLGKFTPAIRDFVAAPGTMTVTLAPSSPVNLSTLEETAKNSPEKLSDLLNLSVAVQPGATPPPAPAPAPTETPQTPLRSTVPAQ